jgi:1,4-dihydroxy-2-naphthoate polyprenyltransferase
MNSLSRFLQYTEIKTKITSVFAFTLCIAYFLMLRWPLRWLPTLVFFMGMLIFDLATTSINNYIDSKSDDTILPFGRRLSLILSVLLVILAAACGIWLVLLSDIFVLFLGACCFVCGIFYTFGPLPISRLPLGELLSGLFYGFFIPWIFFYINLPPADFMQWQWQMPFLQMSVQLPHFLSLVLLAVAPFCCTANIMLANNLCDLDKDLKSGRRTLPSYIGVKAGLWLFALLAVLPFISLVVMVLAKLAHPVALAALLALLPILRNIRRFFVRQDKRETFPLSLHNYLLTMVPFAGAMIAGRWL